jgi:hypothetical protein
MSSMAAAPSGTNGLSLYSLFHAWTAGLEMILDLGVAAIHARVLLTRALSADCGRETGRSSHRPYDAERSAIVMLTAASETPTAHSRTPGRAGHRISLRGGNAA